MNNLWASNSPQKFWRCLDEIPDEQWRKAISESIPVLGLSLPDENIESVLDATLGEGQFGSNHWQLSKINRLYYYLKPYIPHFFSRILRRVLRFRSQSNFSLSWPIEERYVNFLWQVMRSLLISNGEIRFIYFWPDRNHFAFVLTHDIESAKGQLWVPRVAELEQSLGFRSSFNFVPEKYSLDKNLIQSLRQNGFEIGIHGLKHDGKLFNSYTGFCQRANLINYYLEQFDAVGFRSPMTLRQPEWMQALELEYDLSFFDTDPFEPVPGGVMSIWPFELGHFIELPYTLVQDHTLKTILGENTPRIWFEKVDFIKNYHGMALVIIHPDYLSDPVNWKIYVDFLHHIKENGNYWNVLPKDLSSWWRKRATADSIASLPGSLCAIARLKKDQLSIELE